MSPPSIRSLRTRLAVALLVSSIAIAALAADPPFPSNPAAYGGQTMRLVGDDGSAKLFPSATDGKKLRLIVEFTNPPLAQTSDEKRSIAQSTEIMERFRRDVARLIAANPAQRSLDTEPTIQREYSRVFSGAAISISPSLLQSIEKLPYVRRIDRDARVAATPIAHDDLSAPTKDRTDLLATKGAGITVAIIDTGVDYRHPALGGGLGPGFKVIGGYDFVHHRSDPMDDYGHGTHVAGIVAANAPDLMGVAPEASLIAYKVLDANGAGWTSDVIAALERCVDPNGDGSQNDHVDVANISLGFTGSAHDPLSQAVDNAVAAGVVVVVAAGNEGYFQSVLSPGTADAAITVGASDSHDALAPFSSKGPSAGGYAIKPDLLAPGVEIRSTKLGGGTLVASGTSMSSPRVAGAAALILAVHRDWSPAEVKSALVNTTTPVAGEAMATGAGELDVVRACAVATVVAPSQLAFGFIDGNAPTWSATRSFAVTNRGSSAKTYDVVATAPADGIRLTMTPATLTLAPGETSNIRLQVDVDNAKVPYPGASSPVATLRSMAYSGVVELRAPDESLRVPWAFLKSARLRVTYADELECAVFLSGNRAPLGFLPPIGLNEHELLVSPGTYDFTVVSFASVAPDRETTIIVREAQQVSGLNDYVLTPADAPYRMSFLASGEQPLASPRRIRSGVPAISGFVWTIHFWLARHRPLLLDGNASSDRFVSARSPHLGLQQSLLPRRR